MHCSSSWALAATTACATTSFNSTWKAPDAKPVVLSGQKVVAFVLTKNEASRRAAEDALAREITAGGAQGVPSYTLIAAAAAPDEAKAKAQIEGAGATGVVVMRPVDTSKEVVATSTYMGPSYGPVLGWLLRLWVGRRLGRRGRRPYQHHRDRRDAGVLHPAEQADLGRAEQHDEPVEGGCVRARARDRGTPRDEESRPAAVTTRRTDPTSDLDRMLFSLAWRQLR